MNFISLLSTECVIQCMKTVQVTCSKCGQSFLKSQKEYVRRLKRGFKNFYCGPTCVVHSKGHIDGFSSFRVYLKSAKHTSKQKGYECNLDLPFLKSLFEKQTGRCAYTGVKLEIGATVNDKPYSLWAASLDRINSERGYTKDNVEFVCLFVNLGKNGFEKAEVIKFLGELVIISKTRDLQS